MTEDRETPLTRDDILRMIEENSGTANGLDLSGNKRFEDRVDLSGLDLSGINLQNARLFRANLNGSTLDRANFRNASLEYATFNPLGTKITSLQGTVFRLAKLRNAEFRKANLTAAQFQGDFQGGIMHELPAALDETDFRGANLFRTDFTGCFFYGTRFEGAFIRGAEITESNLEQADWGNYIIGEEAEADELHFAENRYIHLKMWYRNTGLYDIAAKFYYREREANRKQLKWRSKNWRHRLATEVTRLLFGYGEEWKRVFYWMALIIFGSTLMYSLFGGLNFLSSFYFSVVSFTALGYGSWVNISPESWMQTVGAAESFVGVFMMALLLVTFVRKWTR